MREGWKIQSLSDICTIRPPKSEVDKLLSPDDTVTFLPMNDLGTCAINVDAAKSKPLKDVRGNYTYFAENDVLLAKITPCFENGKLGIARGLHNSVGFGSSEYFVFRTDQTLLPDYLQYYLSRDVFRSEGERVMGGAVGHKRVPKEFIEQYLIPVPPLPEQQRIVAILDEAFAGIASAVESAEKNLVNSREIFHAQLNMVFGDPPSDWISATIDKHIKFIDYRGRTPKKTSSGVRLITAKNVKMGYVNENPMEFIAAESYDDWMTRGIPRDGDVLFTTEAPLANVAQLDPSEKVAFAQRVIIMQPDRSVLNPTFLKFLLISRPVQSRVRSNETGATVKGIRAKLLKKVLISFPSSMNHQTEIVELMGSVQEESNRLESICQQKLDALAELKQSILQKAFAGELTTAPDKILAEAGA